MLSLCRKKRPHIHTPVSAPHDFKRRLLSEIDRVREEKDLANAMGRKYKEAWEATRETLNLNFLFICKCEAAQYVVETVM